MSRVSDFQAELLAKSPPRFGRWLKIDLHNHSPSSFDYQGNKSSAVADTAAQIRSNDIDVVMFTDHDGLPDKSFVEQVAQQSGKLILRGAELNVFVNAFDKPAGKVDKNVYFHLLVGFDPASDPDYQITHIKRTFSTETRQAGNQTVSGLACDLNSLIDHLNGVGAIVIPAHLHSGKDALFPVSIHETDLRSSRREDFWFIVAARSEDETEIRAGQSAGRSSAEGHSTSDASAVFG